MKKSFSKLFLTALTVLVLTSFAITPIAEARGGGSGRGGGYSGGRQVNNSNRDARTYDVRNTSVNSLNVNVDVDVDRHSGGWDNVDHPLAAAAVVVGAIAVTDVIVGSMVYTVPSDCVQVNYSGMVYLQCGNDWYQYDGTEFVAINPP